MRLAIALALLLPGLPTAHAQVSPGPLARAHAGLEGSTNCFKCHRAGEGGLDAQCLACHKEIAWLAGHSRGLHAREGKAKCASCHPDHAGVDFSLTSWPAEGPRDFDHGRTGWTLAGKHRQLLCADCHKPKLRVSPAAGLAERRDPSKSWVGLDTACASCHEDIHKGALGADCARCHSASTWKEVQAFDHGRTAYPLLGAHGKVPCEKCHMAARLALPVDASGKPGPLFKPVPHAECSDCHQDPHGARLGPVCSKCHVVAAWSQVPRTAFDHERTRYPLRGLHRTVACEKCHDQKTAWGPRPKYATCGSCHRDAHAGRATVTGKPADCAACHDERGWRPSTFTVAQHRESSYPLTGLHTKLACEACHRKDASPAGLASLGSSGVRLRPKSTKCTDCHADAHAGQLSARADRGACEACHRTEGWKPSLFAAREHAQARLALEGRHAEIPCGACHGPDRKDLPPLPDAGAAAGGNPTNEPGNAAGWRGASGPGAGRTAVPGGIPAAGSDAGTSGSAGAAARAARIHLRGIETDCAACHRNPHGRPAGGDVESGPKRDRDGAQGGRAARACSDCHDAKSFSPSKVDARAHQRYAYPLEGAHGAVPCQACHKELEAARGGSSLLLAAGPSRKLEFRDERRTCAQCHADPHAGQFASRPGGGACETCHVVEAFRPASRFDHGKGTSFALDGAHARVACSRCHPPITDGSGRSVVIYRPVPHGCLDCHGGKNQRTPGGTGAGSQGDATHSSSPRTKGDRS